MENYYGGGGSSTDQTVSSTGSWKDSSIRRRRFTSPVSNAFLGPAFNACASSSPQSKSPLDLDPALLRYTRFRNLFPSSSPDSPDLTQTTRNRLQQLLQLRSSFGSSSSSPLGSSPSPLSPIENLIKAAPARSPHVYKTPVKVEVEEDVLVMDGILVSESGANWSRQSSSEFGALGSSSSSASTGNSFYKTEMCRSWEDSGMCRYGSKCQFAHGKEELRGARPVKQKCEVEGQSGSKSVPSAASCVYGSKYHLLPTASAAAVASPGRTIKAIGLPSKRADEEEEEGAAAAAAVTISSEPTFLWPPTKAEDAYIHRVLYGPTMRRRLPVFVQICPN